VRHSRSGFRTRQEAQIAEAEARKSLKRTNSSFIALCESRLKDLKLRRTEKYFRANRALIENLLLRWGKKKEITRDDVEQYLNDIAADSATAANAALREIKALFNHGVERQWITENPVKGIKMYSVQKAKRYIPSEDDIRKVFYTAEPNDRLYLLVIVHTLGRITAINRLKWEDVKEGHISLYTRKARNSDLKEIKIPMNEVLKEALSKIERAGDYVFINPITDKPYYYRSKFLKTLCKNAGVKPFTYHSLRHLSASKLDKEGVPITVIQRLLGHERATTTDIYLQTLRGSVEEAVKKLEDLK
jgi:integrase